MKLLRNYYYSDFHVAARRGIEFNISFDDWLQLWQDSGKLDQRGSKQGQYKLSRIDDTKPYELGNVVIDQKT